MCVLSTLFPPGDNSSHTEHTESSHIQDYLTTDPQDVVFSTSPAEDEVTYSEVTSTVGEEVLHVQTVSVVKQSPVEAQLPTQAYEEESLFTEDFHQTVTSTPDHQTYPTAKDTWEPVQKASYPEAYQPQPEDPEADDTDSHEQPTLSDVTGVVTTPEESTLPTVVGTDSETHTLNTPGVTETSGSDWEELVNSSSGEDHAPQVPFKPTLKTLLFYSTTTHDVSEQTGETSTGYTDEVTTVSTSSIVDFTTPPADHLTEVAHRDTDTGSHKDEAVVKSYSDTGTSSCVEHLYVTESSE